MQLIIVLFVLLSLSANSQTLREYNVSFGTERIVKKNIVFDTLFKATVIAVDIAKAKEQCSEFDKNLKFRVRYKRIASKAISPRINY